MVACQHDQRLVGDTTFFQSREQPANLLINPFSQTIIHVQISTPINFVPAMSPAHLRARTPYAGGKVRQIQVRPQ